MQMDWHLCVRFKEPDHSLMETATAKYKWAGLAANIGQLTGSVSR